MFTSLAKYLSHFARRLIVRVSLYAALALLAVLASLIIGPFLPQSWISYLGAGALETVLTTLASSLLAVTTFSLTILASTFRAVEGSATPRAVLILREDQTTHRILSVFIGAFLFSLTSIILLATPLMTPATRFVLFLVTIIMVFQVVIAMIRWIHHIELLGSIENLLDCLQLKARPVLAQNRKSAAFGANPLDEAASERGAHGHELRAPRDGYVTMIALDALQQEAEACQGRVFLQVQPGDYVTQGDLLMRMDSLAELSEVKRTLLRNAVLLASSRSFDQDPVFCVTVMTEIGNRALSSGVNDSQTAVDVVHRLGGLLSYSDDENDEICYDRIWITPLDQELLLSQSLDVIAREGGNLPEVAEALDTALARIETRGPKALAPFARARRKGRRPAA